MNTKTKNVYPEPPVLTKQDDDFEKLWAEGITIEEARRQMHQFIASWPWKKK